MTYEITGSHLPGPNEAVATFKVSISGKGHIPIECGFWPSKVEVLHYTTGAITQRSWWRAIGEVGAGLGTGYIFEDVASSWTFVPTINLIGRPLDENGHQMEEDTGFTLFNDTGYALNVSSGTLLILAYR